MKNPMTDPPRFACRVVRAWSSLLGDPNRGSAHHLATCESCREYFGACDELEAALRRDAVFQRQDASPGLEREIMRAVLNSTPPARHSTSSLGLLALAGVAAGVALSVFVMTKTAVPVTEPDPLAVVTPGDEPGATVETPSTTTALTKFLPTAGGLLKKNPLQDEVDCVYSDAQSAINFLAANFLPSSSEQVVRHRNRPATS